MTQMNTVHVRNGISVAVASVVLVSLLTSVVFKCHVFKVSVADTFLPQRALCFVSTIVVKLCTVCAW